MADDFDFPIRTDPDLLFNDWLAEVRVAFPQFNPSPNSLSYAVARALSHMIATGTDVAAVIPPAIFRTVISSLFEIAPYDALSAVADTTWTAIDDAGYDPIPAGTIVTIDGVLFQTTDDVLFPSGTTVVTPVGVAAMDEGAFANSLGSPGSTVVLEEGYEYIVSVTLVNSTLGGQDGETTEDFTSRARRTLRVLYPFVAVRASDLEIIARTVPGVYRALAIDLYDAPTSTPNVAGTATLLLQGFDGGAVPSIVKDAVTALIIPDSRRLVNNVLYIRDPTETPVNVTFKHTTYAGFEPASVTAAAEGAVALMFDPTRWGLPQSGEEPLWTNKTIVSEYDIAGTLNDVEGLDRVTEIKLSLNADAVTVGDKTLTGIGPLTTPGTITGTAV